MARERDVLGMSGAETVIGPGVKVKGNLASEGDMIVDGQLEGGIKCLNDVTVGINARVRGSIKGRNITVAGEVLGNLTAEDDVTLAETGRVDGDINCNHIAIAYGARFNGKVTMNVDQTTTNDAQLQSEE